MSHKVHPKIFRIKDITDWNSKGFYGKKIFQFLEEDFKIREFVKNKLKEAALQSVEIERSIGRINVIINTARPGLIIGRGGGGVEKLKKEIEKILLLTKKGKTEVRIEVREVKNPWISSALVAQWIVQQLEKRIHHRRCMKQALDRVMIYQEVKGARIEVAGRLGGSEIARREKIHRGSLPRQTIRADIDYTQEEAYCTFGVLGVKVWIHKGEKF